MACACYTIPKRHAPRHSQNPLVLFYVFGCTVIKDEKAFWEGFQNVKAFWDKMLPLNSIKKGFYLILSLTVPQKKEQSETSCKFRSCTDPYLQFTLIAAVLISRQFALYIVGEKERLSEESKQWAMLGMNTLTTR